jgi:hypothetical protein
MDSSVSAKDEIWFLRMCHHVSNAVYQRHLLVQLLSREFYQEVMRFVPASDQSFTSKWSDFYQQVIRASPENVYNLPANWSDLYQHVIRVLPASDKSFTNKWSELRQKIITIYQQTDQICTSMWSDFYQQVIRASPENDYNLPANWSDLYQQVIRVLQYQEMIKICIGKWWQFCRKVFRLYPECDEICTRHVIRVLQVSDQSFTGKWSRLLPESDQSYSSQRIVLSGIYFAPNSHKFIRYFYSYSTELCHVILILHPHWGPQKSCKHWHSFFTVCFTLYSIIFCPEIMEVLPPYPKPLFDQDCLQVASSGRLQQTIVTCRLISEGASMLPVSANCAVTCLVRSDDF